MGRNVLNKTQREEIYRLHTESGITCKSLADIYGIKEGTVRNIIMNLNSMKPVKPSVKLQAKIKTKTRLIESMSDYALECGWVEPYLVKKLMDCGITLNDFKDCGYGEFVKEYIKIKYFTESETAEV